MVKMFPPTCYVALARRGIADRVIRDAHVRPGISDRGIEQHVASSVSHFGDLLQCVVVVLQGPDKIRLFRVGDGRADHVILALESFSLYVAFGLNCVRNVNGTVVKRNQPGPKTQKEHTIESVAKRYE